MHHAPHFRAAITDLLNRGDITTIELDLTARRTTEGCVAAAGRQSQVDHRDAGIATDTVHFRPAGLSRHDRKRRRAAHE
jgi:hypothetical protein